MKLLENKTAFVSGGSRGIGAAIVESFAQHGANVGFSYFQNADAASGLLEKIAVYGGKYKAYPCNVANPEVVQNTMQAFLAEFGGVDVLVNNAGIIRDQLAAVMPLEAWNEVLSVNLTAAFVHIQEVLKCMIPARQGIIINIGSVTGERGMAGQANYTASKAGLIGLTKSVAKEVGGRNIRCNAIAPGFIKTDMTNVLNNERGEQFRNLVALKRVGEPEEVAKVALFLASDMSSYLTGQVITVCGGLSL